MWKKEKASLWHPLARFASVSNEFPRLAYHGVLIKQQKLDWCLFSLLSLPFNCIFITFNFESKQAKEIEDEGDGKSLLLFILSHCCCCCIQSLNVYFSIAITRSKSFENEWKEGKNKAFMLCSSYLAYHSPLKRLWNEKATVLKESQRRKFPYKAFRMRRF
jgi:hypothetical protein